MLNKLKFVSLTKYNQQKQLTQHWKDKHDIQLQAHQDTIIKKDKAYRDLKIQWDIINKKLKKDKGSK